MHATEAEQVQGSVDPITRLEFVVFGVPIQQGSKKGFSRKGSTFVQIVDDNKATLKPWREHVRNVAETALAGRPGFTRAAFVFLDFHMPRGKTVKRARPSTKPDIDKLTRAILDALTDSGVLKDDGLVVSLRVDEWYATNEPSVSIKVGELA